MTIVLLSDVVLMAPNYVRIPVGPMLASLSPSASKTEVREVWS